MNILQISFGDQIHERMGLVSSILSNLDEGDRYVLIGDRDIGAGNFLPIDEYERKMRVGNPFLYRIYEQRKTPTDRSNILRVHYCAHNDDTLYLDTDAELFEASTPIELDPYYSSHFSDEGPFGFKGPWRGALRVLYNRYGLPAFGPVGNKPDIYMMYNGYNTLFFKQWIDWMVHFSQRAPELPKYWHAGFNRRFHRQKKKLPLVTGFYKHHCLHKTRPRDMVKDETQTHTASQGTNRQAG